MEGFKAHEFMVYSAYYDVRKTDKPIIRVFGVTGSMNPEKVLCRLHYHQNKENLESKIDNNNRDTMNDDESFRDVHGEIKVRREEAEAILIKNHQGELLNSKSEFHQPSLIRIHSEIVKGLDD